MVNTELLQSANDWLMKAIGFERNSAMSEIARDKAVRVCLDRACDKELLAFGFPAKYTLLGALYGQTASPIPVTAPSIEEPRNTVAVG